MSDKSGSINFLCEGITGAREERKRSRSDLKEQAELIRSHAREFMAHCRKVHGERAQGLKEKLGEDRKVLLKKIASLRNHFRKKEKKSLADFDEANRLWNAMPAFRAGGHKTLESRKRGEIK